MELGWDVFHKRPSQAQPQVRWKVHKVAEQVIIPTRGSSPRPQRDSFSKLFGPSLVLDGFGQWDERVELHIAWGYRTVAVAGLRLHYSGANLREQHDAFVL